MFIFQFFFFFYLRKIFLRIHLPTNHNKLSLPELGRDKNQTKFFDMNFMAEAIFQLVKIGNYLDKYVNLGEAQGALFLLLEDGSYFRADERIRAIRIGTV